MSVERSFVLSAWNTSVYDDVLPLAVLEELEDTEALFDSVVVDQVFEEFRVGG